MTAIAFWKIAHILGATILFGTGLGIAFFCWFGYRAALRSGEIAILRALLRLTVIADACVTAPAVLIQLVSGAALVHLMDWSLTSPWALSVYALFVFVGICWIPVLFIQVRLQREANATRSIAALSAGFHKSFRTWLMLGVPAFLALAVMVYLMVVKPLPVVGG